MGLADSAGSGEPGGSVGGLEAFSTSGSGSSGMEGPLETPENNKNIRVDAISFHQRLLRKGILVPKEKSSLISAAGSLNVIGSRYFCPHAFN